jgi:hypothetical protein
VQPNQDLYEVACQFVAQQYARRFSSLITRFYPHMFIACENGGCVAVAGFRGAAADTLFLENYLDAPVEEYLRSSFGSAVDRHHIVELGGFAAINRSSAFALMQYLAPALYELGYEKLVCTANAPIRKCLVKLGLNPVVLAEAASEKVIKGGDDWGNYYASNPRVLAGDIEAGMQAMCKLDQKPR